MCGIVAYFPRNTASTADTDRVDFCADRVRHRGPDGAGLYEAGGAVLAHRRLSIIDVDGGRQPLLDEDGRLGLVCNGEIYNHRRLRADLEATHRFRTRSDSEVILHLYQDLGAGCVAKLDGMFAFVLTDGERLLAARDPLGVKPLYMGRDAEGGLWFASELKSLTGPCVTIEEFPPGHLFTPEGGLRRWFEPSWIDPDSAPADSVAIGAALESAVVKRLMSDVPLGVFLSGGLDSSLIAGLVRKQIDGLHSFSVGLDGSPDILAARSVARHLGTRHHELVYKPEDVVDALETVIFHLESYDPALVRSAIPCFFVSRLAAEHVKVVLSGEGADEAFGGYLYFGEARDPAELHRESVRLLHGLHNMNLQRVDRMTMAHSLEGRVPFLDPEFLNLTMRIDPLEKLHQPGRAEKFLLRRAFDGPRSIIPEEVLWRTKLEFAQGCGSEWTLRDHCAAAVSNADFARASVLFPEDTPATREEFLYRRIFENRFPGAAARRTVGRWRGSWAGRDAGTFDTTPKEESA